MELKLVATAAQERKDPFKEKRDRDREDGRLLALAYAEEALLLHVADMRDPTVDPKIRVRCREYVMNRAWGTPKVTPDEDQSVKNANILMILENFSRDQAQLEAAQRVHPAQSLEHEVSLPNHATDAPSQFEDEEAQDVW